MGFYRTISEDTKPRTDYSEREESMGKFGLGSRAQSAYEVLKGYMGLRENRG